MDVLSFIDEVKAKQGDAEISLISGHSAINIDFGYPILKKEIGPNKEKRRLMFFNKNYCKNNKINPLLIKNKSLVLQTIITKNLLFFKTTFYNGKETNNYNPKDNY